MKEKKYKIDGLAIAGCVINIIWTVLMLIAFLTIISNDDYIIIDAALFSILLGLYVTSFIFTIIFLNGRGFKRTAGILAIFTSPLFIGGIFILVGKQTEIENEPLEETVQTKTQNEQALTLNELMVKYNNWVKALMDEGKYKEAIIKAKEGLRLKEDDLFLNKNIAQSYLRMFDYELALKHFKRALEINSNDKILSSEIQKLESYLEKQKTN